MNFLIGRKLNMSQHFTETGEVIPVTVIHGEPMVVTQVKSQEKDKYSAVQVGIGHRPTMSVSKSSSTKLKAGSKVSKSLQGHTKDLGTFSVLAEFRIKDGSSFSRGQKVDISTFQVGEFVDVVGTSKGRGFAGAMKRHGFHGFPASHGHNKPRSVGSIGQRFPQHVRRGMRMAGHMGVVGATVKNLQVVEVDAKNNLLTVKGAIPGHRNGLIRIISTGKVKPLVKQEVVKEEKKKK